MELSLYTILRVDRGSFITTMRNDKHLAMKLRKQGMSYKKIEKELGIARSTLSGWFSELEWSRDIKQDLTRRAYYITHNKFRQYVKNRQKLWELWREEAREEARRNFPELVKNPLFVAGIMLYWGEGDSKIENADVRLGNTDPKMMHLYTKFLLEICGAPFEKLRGAMILYPDLNEEVCQDFWSNATTLPKEQFTKTQFIAGRHPTKRLSHGICQVRYGSRQLKEKIFVWIDLFHKHYS